MANRSASWKSKRTFTKRSVVAAAARSAARALGVSASRGPPARRSKFFVPSAGNPEVKYLTQVVSGTYQDIAGSFSLLLNGIATGTDNTSRIGRKIDCTSVEYKLCVGNTATNLNVVGTYPFARDCIRVALVYDKQSNGAAPLPQDVWLISGTATDPFGLRDPDWLQRYTVLCDDLVEIDVVSATSKVIERYVKLSLPTQYSGTTNAIADIDSGSLYLIIFDENAAAANLSSVRGYVKMQFTDV